MDNLDWITRLNGLCKSLNQIYQINNGGCAKVAYYIAKELHKQHIPYAIKVYFGNNLTKKDKRKLSKTGPFNSTIDKYYWTHLSIVVQNRTINSCFNNSYVIINTPHCLRWLKAFIDNHEFNPIYGTSNNYIVKSYIKEFFKNNII